MEYVLFHILALVAVGTFTASLLWTYGYIRDKLLFKLRGINVRLRGFIDLSMLLSRFLLPFVPQLRVGPNVVLTALGSAIFAIGVLFIALSVRKLYPKLAYGREIGLVTDGVYSVVRHPMYFGDSIWPLGWSLIFGALCSSMLTPVWIVLYALTTRVEEEALLKIYGEEYDRYRRGVKRIIPFLY